MRISATNTFLQILSRYGSSYSSKIEYSKFSVENRYLTAIWWWSQVYRLYIYSAVQICVRIYFDAWMKYLQWKMPTNYMETIATQRWVCSKGVLAHEHLTSSSISKSDDIHMIWHVFALFPCVCVFLFLLLQ